MARRKKSCVASVHSCLFITVMIVAVIIIRYIVPVRVPGPIAHPMKYKIITGSFALILDAVSGVNKLPGTLKDIF